MRRALLIRAQKRQPYCLLGADMGMDPLNGIVKTFALFFALVRSFSKRIVVAATIGEQTRASFTECEGPAPRNER